MAITKKKTKLECRNIWKIFGDKPNKFFSKYDKNPSADDLRKNNYIGAVRNVSFDVYEGEILMIMGLSGSGKSTLLRAITLLDDATHGEIMYDGKDLLKATPTELIDIRRHKMSMVFQHFGLMPHLTVFENIIFPLKIRNENGKNAVKLANEVIELVDLNGREDYYPHELSGGQQQRVGIARSLIVNPDVWFLDEPFSALDPLIRAEMQDEFLRLQNKLKKTIVFITHDFSEALRLADRIAIMKDGQLVQIGTPEELVTNPANEYVKKFVKDAPRQRFIHVSELNLDKKDTNDGIKVNINDTLDEVLPLITSEKTVLTVVSRTGKDLGRLRGVEILRALFHTKIPPTAINSKLKVKKSSAKKIAKKSLA